MKLTPSHYIFLKKQGSGDIVHTQSENAEVGDELILFHQLITTGIDSSDITIP